MMGAVDGIGGILALLLAALTIVLGAALKMLGVQRDKLKAADQQLEVIREHVRAQQRMQERIEQTRAENAEREAAAVQQAREGRRDHFERQP